MSLVFYVSFAFYFVKMQLCVAKKRLCSGFYTSTPVLTPAVHSPYSRTFTTEYSSIRYVPCVESRCRRCAMTFLERRERSPFIWQWPGKATDRRWSAQGIMILLYGAGGIPSGSESSWTWNQSGVWCLPRAQGVLRTNNVQITVPRRIATVHFQQIIKT